MTCTNPACGVWLPTSADYCPVCEHDKPPSVAMKRKVHIAPMGKSRPKVTRNGTYMPSKYTNWKADFRKQFGELNISGNVSLSMTAVRPMPKSWSKRKRNMMLGEWCSTTPDLDNIAGAVMDAVMINDARVVEMTCRKIWGIMPAVIVEFAPAGDPPNE